MPIDYSKWDHLELSDDSDIEVHPNVDKRSFIRWKQQDIHQKRLERNNEINNLNIQIPMYQNLNKRVNHLLQELSDDQLVDFGNAKAFLSKNYDDSKPMDDGPSYNEMIEDLFIQLKADLEKDGKVGNHGSSLRTAIKNHVSKIEDVLKQQKEKLDTLLKEKSLQISSDDIKTGWDRSFLNKNDSASKHDQDVKPPSPSETVTPSSVVETESSQSTTTQTTAIASAEQASRPSSSVAQQQSQPEPSKQSEKDFELEDVHPDTLTLSTLPTDAIPTIKQFIHTHPHIISTSQKDSLLMKAFDSQFQNDDHKTKQIIFFSTLIQYIHDIVDFKRARNPNEIAAISDQLVAKLFDGSPNNRAFEAFSSEVERTFQHIKTRCQVLSQEQDDEDDDELKEIQLRSLDDNTKLIVNLPEENSNDPKEQERLKIFNTLPENMIQALKTQELDKVNEVFHGMPIKEAEQILEVFDQCEIIGVQALIENEEDWGKIKDQYDHYGRDDENADQPVQQSKDQEIEIPKIEETQISTSDIVD